MSLIRPRAWIASFLILVLQEEEINDFQVSEDAVGILEYNGEDSTGNTILEDDNEMQPIDNTELKKYRSQYIKRMCQDADVHYYNFAFSVGDYVVKRILIIIPVLENKRWKTFMKAEFGG